VSEERPADGVEEMGLSEADAAIDEERVVAACGFGGDGDTSGVRELIGGADDKALEGIALIKTRFDVRLCKGGAWEFAVMRGEGVGRERGVNGVGFVEVKDDLNASLAELVSDILDIVQVVEGDPFMKILIRNKEVELVFLRGGADRLNPDLEVLRTHPLLEDLQEFTPKRRGVRIIVHRRLRNKEA
jgi:hypothetical protein